MEANKRYISSEADYTHRRLPLHIALQHDDIGASVRLLASTLLYIRQQYLSAIQLPNSYR
jgi:hypothetical protein